MSRRRSTLLTMLLATGVAAAAIVILTNTPKQHPQPAQTKPPATQQSSDADIKSAITAQSTSPSLKYGSFAIDSTQEPVAGWIIAKVAAGQNEGTTSLILHRSPDSSLVVIMGPGTAFSLNALQAAGVPQEVINKLVVYTP